MFLGGAQPVMGAEFVALQRIPSRTIGSRSARAGRQKKDAKNNAEEKDKKNVERANGEARTNKTNTHVILAQNRQLQVTGIEITASPETSAYLIPGQRFSMYIRSVSRRHRCCTRTRSCTARRRRFSQTRWGKAGVLRLLSGRYVEDRWVGSFAKPVREYDLSISSVGITHVFLSEY